MGCDIHMFVEYKRKDSDYWQSLGGRINPGRNYFMFGILSKGVRSMPSFSFEPKGIPENMSYSANEREYILISEDREIDGESWCSLEDAKRWERNGSKILYHNGKPWKVEHPDWHSHSWLTIEEYKKALDFYKEECVKENYDFKEPEYSAILAAMQELESHGLDVRIVFWFDN